MSSHEGSQYEYEQWRNMVRSCTHPGDKNYSRIGGRGVGIYQPWRESFANFLKDMGHAPPGGVLRRKDTNKAFNPDNAFWGAVNGGDS